MADKQLIIRGTKKDQKLFTEVMQHYTMAKEDLEARYSDWDTKQELFYSYIDENEWPYMSQIFVPQTFTTIYEKMARLHGGKPRGRLIPREGGDVIKAKINNELLNFQWDEATRVDDKPMVAKWAKMDMNARIFGAAFGLIKWHYDPDNGFDGPSFKVLNVRDCLPNPSYGSVKNWFQYRDYVTLQELETVNDVSKEKPTYKNLKHLREAVENESKKGGDTRDVNYTPRYREIQGLTDYLGRDEAPEFRIVEIITEYRNDRKIVFAPRHGVILQDVENPYEHKQIPIVTLKYIDVDDDIWGLSEIEPIEKVQKALNALSSQFVDAVNMDLYRILQVRPTAVQMHTLEWGPGKKWLMNNPGQDVVPMEHSVAATNQFVNVYSVLTQMLKEAMGETSAAFSSLQPFASEKTATEIADLQTQRNARDRFNQVFLAEAIKKQMHLWLLMNKQFVFSDPSMAHLPLRIVGKDAMQELLNTGIGDYSVGMSAVEALAAADLVEDGVIPDIEERPTYPVYVDGEQRPKFELDETGEVGTLYMTPEDMTGYYDYTIDVEPMHVASTSEERRARLQAVGFLTNPAILQMLQAEGKKPKISDVLVDLFDQSGLKGSEKYFDVVGPESQMGGGESQGVGGEANIGDGSNFGNFMKNPELGGINESAGAV